MRSRPGRSPPCACWTGLRPGVVDRAAVGDLSRCVFSHPPATVAPSWGAVAARADLETPTARSEADRVATAGQLEGQVADVEASTDVIDEEALAATVATREVLEQADHVVAALVATTVRADAHAVLRGLRAAQARVGGIDEVAAAVDGARQTGDLAATAEWRRVSRFPCQQDVVLRVEGRENPATALDLGLGGARVTTAPPQRVGVGTRRRALAAPQRHPRPRGRRRAGQDRARWPRHRRRVRRLRHGGVRGSRRGRGRSAVPRGSGSGPLTCAVSPGARPPGRARPRPAWR